jgi:hypothetical protein
LIPRTTREAFRRGHLDKLVTEIVVVDTIGQHIGSAPTVFNRRAVGNRNA